MEFTDPVPLDSINSDGEDIAPILARDGKALYFVRAFNDNNVGGRLTGMDIWASQKDSLGNWQRPTNDLPHWNNRENNAVVGIRKDNKVIYLLNSYFRGKGIAFSKFLGNKWIKPELLPFKWVPLQDYIGFYMHPDFDVLLMSLKGEDSFGEEDIYISLKDSLGRWSAPVNLGPTVNSEGFETSPFLSADKRHLYFASNGLGGYGDADIWMSERLYDNWRVWSKPVNLGDKINSTGFDAYFSIGEDSTVYFASDRSGGLSDIYSAKRKLRGKDVLKDSINAILSQADSILNKLEKFNKNRNLQFNISFESGKATLSQSMSSQIRSLLDKTDRRDLIGVVLRGFSSKYGNNNLNLQLIEKRINVISEYLVTLGVGEKDINKRSVTFNSSDSSFEDKIEMKLIFR